MIGIFSAHIPPNTEYCIKAWNREYRQLVQKFAHIISGQFSSHTHNESFTIVYSTHNHERIPVNVDWIGGSGTPHVGMNPSYRLYTVEPNTFEVIDLDTFTFNLTEANLTPNQPPEWFKAYNFREAFGVEDLSPHTLSKLVNVTWRHDRKSLHKVGAIANRLVCQIS